MDCGDLVGTVVPSGEDGEWIWGQWKPSSRPAWDLKKIWGMYMKVEQEHSFESMGMDWFWSFG
jgi:hypothetical protein